MTFWPMAGNRWCFWITWQPVKLNLTSLSKAVGIAERSISEALNGHLNKNFYQFVNEYRIKDVQEKLMNPENTHLKILSLAFDAGFNSKATFNRLFKSYTGLTPKEFKLLETLAKEPGRAFTRLELVERAFGYDYEGLERTVDAHVMNLRKKIEHDHTNPNYVETVYGVGYRFMESTW